MPNNTTNTAAILRPEQVADLVIKPALAQAIAAQATTVQSTASNSLRIPLVTSDPTTGWVAEEAEIPLSTMGLDELVVTPSKVAGLVSVSREAADDTSPAATTSIGNGLARDIARKLDAAFAGNLASPAPKGLASLKDADVSLVTKSGAFANGDSLDAFAEAASMVEVEGGSITAWLAHPNDALALGKLKAETNSVVPLLSADPTQAARRTIEGRPVLVSPSIAPGTIYGVDKLVTFLVLREDTRVEVDGSAFFTSDRIAVRAVMRAGFGFANPKRIARVKVTTS
ncbi:phage major capsid protein [Kineococcus rhizosphaerae]|uniref:HK97 family phage major capsid protein n=1 Tax=Kineococcus rhizosphaerae TaxID=559628 RepID=A0A2T0QLR6_9ACTN|nr:phage major capsid protein [Kineococcus rhizosphaerae]PRY05395.1 HK97 family phage major capsid protein [Kineococcus rhizosphaerae]